MIQTLYITLDGDSYEVEVDTSTLEIKSVWRYSGNRTIKPDYINPKWLGENTNYRTLKNEIDNRMMKQYG